LIFLCKETKNTVVVGRIYIDYPNKKYFIDFDLNCNFFGKDENLWEKNELIFLFEEFYLFIISWIRRRVRLSFIVDLFSDGREKKRRENIGYNPRSTKIFGKCKIVFFLWRHWSLKKVEKFTDCILWKLTFFLYFHRYIWSMSLTNRTLGWYLFNSLQLWTKIISDIEKEFLNFKRNFYGQFPSKICKNSKTLTGAGQKFLTATRPGLAGRLPLPVPSLIWTVYDMSCLIRIRI
jgi:hypothetical protein